MLLIFQTFLDTPVKEASSKTSSSDSNLFTSFLSAPTETTSNVTSTKVANGSGSNVAFRTKEEDSFFNQSLSATPNKLKPLTKDSILALYGNVLIHSQLFFVITVFINVAVNREKDHLGVMK